LPAGRGPPNGYAWPWPWPPLRTGQAPRPEMMLGRALVSTAHPTATNDPEGVVSAFLYPPRIGWSHGPEVARRSGV